MKDAHTDTQIHAKMFYSQRNMYLTGFTLFLAIVCSRLIAILSEIMKHEEKIAVVEKQAKNQQKEYERLTEEKEKLEKELEERSKLTEELQKKSKDAEVVLKQAKSQQEEYLRLADKYNDLEKKYERREYEEKKSK
ncbi:B-cell receptor-associated 31-like domain-containing protein [Rozella allomycis CSF55]|uniref:Endoplasmic reticulum transmembrane protein n=1 Tax=Rozella allomycis (strain CSF55) TaxID=988480 RepID=A0A075AW24_ROZAC|nr:B-cell receptor-associated 31-like domain-containing protein [Rozella allomycis CSF55]|eukprot:EPZ34460.1 B-cell receptor-associated 31-like domain-containing protein [Rozella allomycis CSF55]